MNWTLVGGYLTRTFVYAPAARTRIWFSVHLFILLRDHLHHTFCIPYTVVAGLQPPSVARWHVGFASAAFAAQPALRLWPRIALSFCRCTYTVALSMSTLIRASGSYA